MSQPEFGPCPPRLADLKREIAASYPNFETRVTKAWGEILNELEKVTKDIVRQGSQGVPEVKFDELQSLSPEVVAEVRNKGCLVIRDVVDDTEARTWQTWLREYVAANPNIDGMPEDDKQFFQLYWTKSQIRARSHPNILAATVWLNHMYHAEKGENVDDVRLDIPLTYADRFRIRHPGVQWDAHPPHVDSGSIERWEDENFRECFADILSGNWRQHDPYDLTKRINAKSSLYQKPDQASKVSVFRTYQGWLALSETAPTEGTLQVFPNVILSNAYITLRPFFIPKEGRNATSFDPNDWQYDISSPDFPGIYSYGPAFAGPRPDSSTHPHLKLDETMVSVPKVYPGDMVFWHCDMIHAVEKHHTGKEDSTVMYIPAMPYTPNNAAYIQEQKESFLKGLAPPDFPDNRGDAVGSVDDIGEPIGKRAMGFAIAVA